MYYGKGIDILTRRLNIQATFKEVDWGEFYPDAEDYISSNIPKTVGEAVKISLFVDANHAGNVITRRSHTGFCIFINGVPIIWWSKRQNTVESSTFGSEYVALRIGIEQVIALRFKLFYLGIKVENPADVFCDNEAVVNNSSVPASVLSKRHNAICYHRVRESAAAGIVRVAHIRGDSNPADLFTKLLPDVKRKWMVKFLTGGNE